MGETLKERKRKEREQKIKEVRKRQKRRLIIFSIATVLALAFVVFFLNSPYFKVKSVEIKGIKNADTRRVNEVRKILMGKNIIRAPLSRAKNLLLNDSWIRKVEFDRDFPNKITVKVSERKPVAQISKDGFFYLVSEDGMVLEKQVEPGELIEIADIPLKSIKVGSIIRSKEFSEAMEVYNSFDGELKKKVLVISATSVDKLIFYISGTEVIYGNAEYTEEKNKILKEILKKEGKKAISIDLRIPDNPVVKTQP